MGPVVFEIAAAHGVNCIEEAVDKGMETMRWSGQRSTPVVMPTNETLQGILYTAKGEVVSGPEDNGQIVDVIARNVWPPR